jgi:hypothetical protein
MKYTKEQLRMQQIAGIITENQLPEELVDLLNGMIDGEIPEYAEEGDILDGIWDMSEYGDADIYDQADDFRAAYDFIKNNGGTITIEGNPDVTYTSTPKGNIKYELIVTLD